MGDSDATVPLAELRDLLPVGEPLPCRVLDAAGRLLLAAGQKALGPEQIEALIERGACVPRDEADALRAASAAAAAGAGADATPAVTWFDAWEHQMWALDKLLRRALREPDPGLGSALGRQVEAQIELVDHFADGALFLAVRQDDRRFALYALTHGMHTATVALLAARLLGWPPERQRALVGAALTMNAAIAELQARMAEQAEPPNKTQLDAIRGHPARAAALLRACGVADAGWLVAVEQHHERGDGSGYPAGLSQVDETARLLRVADVFTARISPRALRVALLPQVAARQAFQDEAGGPLAAALIKAVGIYPPGDWVRLESGEVGVVAHRAQTGRGAEVAVLRSAQGRPVADAPRRDTAAPGLGISGPVADRQGLPRVLPEQIYGLVYV